MNTLNLESDYLELQKTDSYLFLAIETMFNDWLDTSNPANEYYEMYYGDDAIYTKKGAIIGAIENIFDYMSYEQIKSVSLTDNDIIDIIYTSFE